MSDLRLDLGGMDFEQLVELGRSLIPTFAPDWTDHNIHDPGIMLIDLLAWTADAQIYSLSRMRRDERLAYAKLLGVQRRGPQPARGLVWPSNAAVPDGMVLDSTTPVATDHPGAPTFHLQDRIRLTAATLQRVQTRCADGRSTDWTGVNAQDGATFMPFGPTTASGDRLVLVLEPPPDMKLAGDGFVSIGVEIVPPAGAERAADDEVTPAADVERLRVAVEDAHGERPVELVRDTTTGLLRSGVLLLRFTATPAGDAFAITIRSATGTFLVSPRVRRIAVNVLPVEQIDFVEEEDPTFGRGLPDQLYQLQKPGFVFSGDAACLSVSTLETGGPQTWRHVGDLEPCGPDERVFVLDPVAETLSFGNGVNGAVPPSGSVLRVEYRVCSGARGNLPDHVDWTVRGILGVFGTNGEPIGGGADGRDLDALRAVAARRVREARPCVTAGDLAAAALSFTDLGVRRAIEAPARVGAMRGTRTLVVAGPHDALGGAGTAESSDWLEEIRSRLAPRLPLGQRLQVIAPRYVDVRVVARLVAEPRANPETVRQAAEDRLREALAVVADDPNETEWPFGRDVTPLTVKAWLRKIDGVARVVDVTLLQAGRPANGAVELGAIGLPRLQIERGDIAVDRWSNGDVR
jgi:hypothetical protein